MPPKFKFSKNDIISAAVQIVRDGGMSALTARSLAQKLGSSVKPIFGQFENMQELQLEVLNSANALYQSYITNDMSEGKYPPYKASGMAYIRFAKEEKELFKLLFMRDRSGEHFEENRDDIQPMLNMVMQSLGITEDEAFMLHLELWIYVHGIAAMIATDYLEWDTEFISNALTDAYQGLKHRYTKE